VADTARLADLDRAIAATREFGGGGIDVVFANAGVGTFGPLAATSESMFDTTFDTNVKGVYFTVQKAVPLMSDGGSIILMSSGMNVKGFPAYGVYAATKAAIRSFTRTWAAELTGSGIRVNVVSPGVIETPILEKQFAAGAEMDEATAQFEALTPMGRLGQPQEIAGAVFFLASNDSSYITGFDLVVDGGITEI
ncbi:MAG: SDR family oxidoreductase, partial [Mycobacterium sp.]